LSFVIRAQVRADAAPIAALECAVLGHDTTPEEVIRRASSPTYAGLVAERNGWLIGCSSTGFKPTETPSGDLRCIVLVDPAQRRQGVGAALWEALQPVFQKERPQHLRANGIGTEPDSLAWAERRGFVQAHRLLFQTLELADFDLTPWLDQIAQVDSAGFRFATFAELRSPAAEVRLHALFQAFRAATPDYAPSDDQPFETWRAWAFDAKGAWPEGWVLMLAPDGDWAGFTMLQKTPRGAHIFMTGVAPAYRGRGLATPLKVAALVHAQESGVARLTTLNHAANERIVAVNRALGYRVTEDVIRLVKRCDW
jgi:GNAT superfamily N-acetyltransferase